MTQRIESALFEENHIPNNVVPNSKVSMSQQEIDEIKAGKPFPSWKFIPWILDELNYELMKRPPPPEPEEPADGEELTEEEKAKREKEQKKKQAEEAKRLKEEEEAKKAKEERRKKREEAIAAGQNLADLGLEESDEEIKIDDLSIDDLVLKTDENQKAPHVGGFILLGFPTTELHAQKLKEHGIGFDRIIFMTDQSEEGAGNQAKELNKKNMHYSWEEELEKAQKILAVANEQFAGEDAPAPEIDAVGSIDDVFIRI